MRVPRDSGGEPKTAYRDDDRANRERALSGETERPGQFDGNGSRRRGDGVNGVGAQRGKIWLSETVTDPSRRTENFGGVIFSVVLTPWC